jgi:hypothetical protein
VSVSATSHLCVSATSHLSVSLIIAVTPECLAHPRSVASPPPALRNSLCCVSMSQRLRLSAIQTIVHYLCLIVQYLPASSQVKNTMQCQRFDTAEAYDVLANFWLAMDRDLFFSQAPTHLTNEIVLKLFQHNRRCFNVTCQSGNGCSSCPRTIDNK